MREPLDHCLNHYERPNQPWVCGLASEGQACPAGPTLRGQCPALAECAPTREGDRWQCNRSPLRGGECDQGPSPEGACGRVHRCRPVRSLRAIRRRLVTSATLFSTGLLVILLSADGRDSLVSPGPLASPHAQLLSAQKAGPGCTACHAAAERSAAGWATSLLVGHPGHASQSARCIDCHESTIAPDLALAVHNLSGEALQQLLQPENHASATDRELACAACHRDHQGAAFDMTAIGNAACQECHQQRYESFAEDHPDFGAWPYLRRTRIHFNHASHSGQHHPAAKQPFDCRACHVEDATGTAQLTANYETACAACHDDKIAMSTSRGVPMLALPTLDVAALRAAGHNVAAWPPAATGDFDGRLPPMMKLLLAADPRAARAFDTLGVDFEFLDVDPEDPQHLAAAADVAVAIQQLLRDLQATGTAAVGERLAASLGRDIDSAELKTLVAGLSDDTIANAAAAWLAEPAATDPPQLRENVAPSPTTADTAALPNIALPRNVEGGAGRAPRPLAFAPAGTWKHDPATFTVRYRAAGHGDPVLAGWLALLAGTPDVEAQPLTAAMLSELSAPTAAGLCASCHALDQAGPEPAVRGRLVIQWRGLDPTHQPRTLTRFSHGPHLLLPQLADCTSCHAIDTARSTANLHAGRDPYTFASEFAPMSKNACATCHTATAAGDACQSCHRYHVDEVQPWRLAAPPALHGP